MNSPIRIPLVIRGELIEDYAVEFAGRHGGAAFTTCDAAKYANRLAIREASRLADLYALSFAEIADYLEQLGERLDFTRNGHMREAYELARRTSGMSDAMLLERMRNFPKMFRREVVYSTAERSCGLDFLEGWVEQTGAGVPGVVSRVRAFGARAVHVIAGNTPDVSALTIIRNAITRSDCIIKTPSNDPLTAVAMARTMIEMAPDHPITRHLSVAYWKGGDEAVESAIYVPGCIEKIVAWGGFGSIRHITRYLQPGIDLITLDPKLSGTIIGEEAFADDATLQSVARRLALDIGAYNQEGCVNARVVYVQSGTCAAGLDRCARLAELTFAALQQLPETISTPHKDFNPELKEEIDSARMLDDEYQVWGGRSNEGAIIVSLGGDPVDFSRELACRVGNLVPIDTIETAIKSVNAYTQTMGIFPESLKDAIRDRLALHGAQRLVSLGGAWFVHGASQRQDGIETVRRMCKWIVDETGSGESLEAIAAPRSQDAAA